MFDNFTQVSPVYYFLIAWSLLWKGLALWRTGRSDQKYWFFAILLVNTFGFLEILYLFRFAKKRLTIDEIKSWKRLLPTRAK